MLMTDEMKGVAPPVTVVIAAYNRSYTLRHALRSALAQDFADFEILVVGDACTDDTEEVVASFADPRVRFLNLKLNYGEQSGPNNTGVAHARGRYIAFLSQDDFWFPDHLSAAVGWLEASGADMVHTLVAEFDARGPGLWAAGLAAEGRGPFFDPFRDVARASMLAGACRRVSPPRSVARRHRPRSRADAGFPVPRLAGRPQASHRSASHGDRGRLRLPARFLPDAGKPRA